jgi:hypothetical protein
MAAIWETKERTQTETPLFLFDFEWKTGATERWSTHGVQGGGVWYEARVEGHNLFKMCSDADEGIDSLPKLTVELANADSRCSQIERSRAWKGARVTVRFLFYDLKNGAPATETTVVFRGVAGPPERITESAAVIPASNRMNLQRCWCRRCGFRSAARGSSPAPKRSGKRPPVAARWASGPRSTAAGIRRAWQEGWGTSTG